MLLKLLIYKNIESNFSYCAFVTENLHISKMLNNTIITAASILAMGSDALFGAMPQINVKPTER